MLTSQLCPTLCDPMDCSMPGSSVHEILQARILEWAAIPFSWGFSWPTDQTWVSRGPWIVGGFLIAEPPNYGNGGSFVAKSGSTLATPWTVAHQALFSMGISRQEYWSGLVDISFCRGSSWSRNQTSVSCFVDGLMHCRQIIYCWDTVDFLKIYTWGQVAKKVLSFTGVMSFKK